MEYVDGGTVDDILEYFELHPLHELQIRYIMFCVCKGIRYLHMLNRCGAFFFVICFVLLFVLVFFFCKVSQFFLLSDKSESIATSRATTFS
jgi:serine/threonine protein kinase